MNEDNQTTTANPTNNIRPFRGRFMDVVHPSSDVKILEKANYASEKQVYQSATIQPSNVLPADLTKETSGVFEPLEFAQFIEATTAADIIGKTQPTEEEAQVEKTSDDVQPTEPEREPLKSPFLTGVKVDKRPLGSNDESVAAMPDWLQRGLDELNNLELPADDGGSGELELELPANSESLSHDEKESDSDSLELSASAIRSEPALQPPRDIRAALENTMIQPQHGPADATSAHPASQYVYTGHEPISSAKVKKHIPAWTWLLIYFLLIIVGGAIGVFVYLSGWLS